MSPAAATSVLPKQRVEGSNPFSRSNFATPWRKKPTDPTWTDLDDVSRSALEAHGGPLWHSLLAALRPHVVALSVARHHLSRIEFVALTEWVPIRVFGRTGAGAPRARPVRVSARWYGRRRAIAVRLRLRGADTIRVAGRDPEARGRRARTGGVAT